MALESVRHSSDIDKFYTLTITYNTEGSLDEKIL